MIRFAPGLNFFPGDGVWADRGVPAAMTTGPIFTFPFLLFVAGAVHAEELTSGVDPAQPMAAAAPTMSMSMAPSPDKSRYTLFDPTPDDAMRSFMTDRPPKANSPYTVDAGHFQYETDLVVFSEGRQDGAQLRAWTAPDPTFKLGLTNTIDVELQLTPYQEDIAKAGGVTQTLSGWGDTYARLKVNLFGDDGGDVAVALLPYIKLPTPRTGLGDGRVEAGLILPISVSAPFGFMITVMPEVDILKDTIGGGDHATLDFLINVSHPLTKAWTLYSELFTTQSTGLGDRPIYTWDEALTYALTPNLQLDFGCNLALNGVPPRSQLYVGLSQRF
jgi:hypothetical protein